MTIQILPTCVPQSFDDVVAVAQKISSFAPAMHLDVVDGFFAPEHTWPYESQGKSGEITLEGISVDVSVHLMIEEPREIGVRFIEAGAKEIMGHVEAFADSAEILGSLKEWKNHGARAGLALLLDTPLEVLEPLISYCDFVHVMTIASIGQQGIPYDRRGVDHIRTLHTNFPNLLISADGGISEHNIGELAQAGARRFGVGSAIMNAPDPLSAYHKIKATAEAVL